MATIFASLQAINAYPIPQSLIEAAAAKRGLLLDAEMSQEDYSSAPYRLASADVMLWLSNAPNVAQGGQTYSFGDEQRKQLRQLATEIFAELDEASIPKPIYGYKGSRL